jgi:hypothetical protein
MIAAIAQAVYNHLQWCGQLLFLKEIEMKLNPPKNSTWLLAVVLGVVGLVSSYITIPVLSTLSFWLVALGWLLLVLATYMKGL